MALNKQPLNINFSKGLDTKTDPFQIALGNFQVLENSVFDVAGRLTKRNGYGPLTALPDTTSKYVTTFNGGLTAIGTNLYSLSESTGRWTDKGSLLPISLKTLPLVKSNTNQTQADSAQGSNGLICTAYTDLQPDGTNTYMYVIADSVTGQNVILPTAITGAHATLGTPRVFTLGTYFIILYTTSANHLEYIAISMVDPTAVSAPTDIASSYAPASTVAFDALTVGNRLYIAYNTTSGGQSVKVTYLTPTSPAPATPVTFASEIATMFTLAADETNPANPFIYVSYYDEPSKIGKTLIINSLLNVIKTPTTIIIAVEVLNLASVAQNAACAIYYEVDNEYAYSSVNTNVIQVIAINQAGSVGSPVTVIRSLGLASKAFLRDSIPYFLGVYESAYQPSYFLVDGATGEIVAKLAYSNAGPYHAAGLPAVSLIDDVAYIPYLYKETVEAVGVTGNTTTPGVYAQLGINQAAFNFSVDQISASEIGSNLNISGGFISAYDGFEPVEQEFFLYPDNIEATPNTSGGSMIVQQYFYQVTYEWSDNQGNLFRSAPSLPISANVTGGGGAGSVTLDIPTLRLTYKITNPVKICIYRWSTAQQTYYQVTSITAPVLNDTTTDYIEFTDTLADTAIIGNNILYTTGGVIENISPPASDTLALFNNRLWLVDAEDRNLLWFSKQVIESTPVEMSDLLTLYVAPTTAAQQSTGPITAISPMDDKLIIFKEDALGYINGIGPDNTGANNGYSDFILISSVVGSMNQRSIVLTPNGLMFQSNKGIWIVGRDLSTQYIGAPVETFTIGATVQSAVNVPGTNQVRFTLDTGITLMYDYFYGQWGVFKNVPAISSTIYEGLHTYIDQYGRVFQETPGLYLDNSSAVLMKFTTGWLSLAGIQGYERFYQMYLLGQYFTPFKLNVQFAYDYNSSPSQAVLVTPTNVYSTWGSESVWGGGPNWGSTSKVFEERVFPSTQKCESFQVTVTEVYDPSQGVVAGQGLTLSGVNLVIGMKKGYRVSSAAKSSG